MPVDSSKWNFDFTRVIRFFTRQEVKTPLSFFFKVIPYLTAVWVAILYAPIPSEMKFSIIKFTAWIFLVICALVFVFAWFRPRHLVYGETTYRAERKMEFGTEQRSMNETELDQLRPISDRTQRRIEKK